MFYWRMEKGGGFIGQRKEHYCGYVWEKGKRLVNQDSLAFRYLSRGKERRWLGVICDGIGGLQEGENASAYAVRQLTAWFMGMGLENGMGKKQERLLQQLFFQIHEEIREYGRKKGIRLGTTVTFVMGEKEKFLWGHCGDCRLYLFQRGRLKQLSADHRTENGSLNRALGTGEWHLLQMGRGRLGKRDKLLLGSDGFYRGLDLQELEHLLKRCLEKKQAERLVQMLYERKLAMGEQDNISALLVGRRNRK